LNEELLKAGLAWWYRSYSKNLALGELEQRAREQGLGLWSEPLPVAPWEFRKK